MPTNTYYPPPDAEQAGTSTRIQAWGTRLFNAVYPQPHALWTVLTTGCILHGDTAQRSCLQWVELDPGTATVLQQGVYGILGSYVYAGAVAANAPGGAVLVFEGSNKDNHVGIYYAVIDDRPLWHRSLPSRTFSPDNTRGPKLRAER